MGSWTGPHIEHGTFYTFSEWQRLCFSCDLGPWRSLHLYAVAWGFLRFSQSGNTTLLLNVVGLDASDLAEIPPQYMRAPCFGLEHLFHLGSQKKRPGVHATFARLLEQYTEVLGKSTLLVQYLGSTLTFRAVCVQ